MRSLTLGLALLLGISGGVLSHNGWGGEVPAIFYGDGEGNVDVGPAAYLLAAFVVGSFLALLALRCGPAAPIASATGLVTLLITCAIVSTETDWVWMYLPGTLLALLWSKPRARRIWSGITGGVLLALLFFELRYTSEFDLGFFIAAIHGAPALAALSDIGPLPSDSRIPEAS